MLTNAYYFLGAPDVILGPVANLVAAFIVLTLRKRRLLACISGALPVGLIVGGYLWLFFGFEPPAVLNVLPAWSGMIVSITISSLISVGLLGYTILSLLSSPKIIEPLRSHGLKVLTDKQHPSP